MTDATLTERAELLATFPTRREQARADGMLALHVYVGGGRLVHRVTGWTLRDLDPERTACGMQGPAGWTVLRGPWPSTVKRCRHCWAGPVVEGSGSIRVDLQEHADAARHRRMLRQSPGEFHHDTLVRCPGCGWRRDANIAVGAPASQWLAVGEHEATCGRCGEGFTFTAVPSFISPAALPAGGDR
ncbi:hypothetical protein L6R53_14110 [Myxococcota bacterium]|nr:hypothetical protein [Myxococcota bacterium]